MTPEPLVPPEVDLRGYEFMPFYGDILFGSRTYIQASLEAKIALPRIWWRAYAKEIPASSLPDDDLLLADYAGYGIALKAWRKVRPQVMRGFVLCSDGRLYHPFVARIAMGAWKSRLADRLRGIKARIGSTQKRLKDARDDEKAHLTALLQAQEHELSQVHAWSVTASTHRLSQSQIGEDRIGEDIKTPPQRAAEASTKPPPEPEVPAAAGPGDGQSDDQQTATMRGLIAKTLREEGVKGVTPSHPTVVGWVERGVTVQLLREAIDLARESKPKPELIPILYLVPIVERLGKAPTTGPALNGKPWFIAGWSQIVAKGAELGIVQERDEGDAAFRLRVLTAAGVTEDQVRKASADYGVTA